MITREMPACYCGEPVREVAANRTKACRGHSRPQVWPPDAEQTRALCDLARRGRLAGVAASLWGTWVNAA